MLNVPSRTALASLTEEVNAVAPSIALGFARRLADGLISVVYSSRLGFSEQVVDDDHLPRFLQPWAGEIEQASLDVGGSSSEPAVEWQLRFIGVDSLLSIPIADVQPPARFWIGLASPNVFTPEQIRSLEGLVASCRQTLIAPMSLEEEVERLRRLDLAAELFPALLHVLDVREVFDRLSAMANRALPHDWLLLRRFNDDLSTTDVFARSGQATELSSSSVSAVYPPEVLRAWRVSIIDDLTTRPPDADQPLVERGARSALRLSIRFNDRLIGALVFLSVERAKYTTSDVVVGRRLADHVAGALSHQSLAERLVDEAKQSEELRARATNLELLDELLAAIIDSGDLADVFGRISATTQKVLAHDAALLMVRLPDDVHARTYASSGFSPPLPAVTRVPEELLQNPEWEHHIFRDIVGSAPRYRALADRGFNSLLRVPIRLDGKFAGALVFLSKGLSSFAEPDILIARRIADRLALTLSHDRELQAAKRADAASERAVKLEARVRALTEELDSRTGYRRVVGESASWRQVLTQATQVAATDTTVLLLGESGTGKEVVARFLHRASTRKNGPFVALNCAALPEQLLEAELFGYERGAFTGATQSKPGQLEQAAGGTLFLDEVGEMSPSAQAKFLRVLQEREFQRLGGTRVLRTDARIIAATNRDLDRAIITGQFREDLYYRLNVFAIRLPPLRDRRDDILPLSEAFVAEIGRSLGTPPAGISRDARKALIEYRWPGNVRELRNILERAAILCDGGLIAAEHLALDLGAAFTAKPLRESVSVPAPVSVPPPSVPEPTSTADLQTMERAMIEQALQSARFNKSKAAKALGLSRHQLYIRMRRYGFE